MWASFRIGGQGCFGLLVSRGVGGTKGPFGGQGCFGLLVRPGVGGTKGPFGGQGCFCLLVRPGVGGNPQNAGILKDNVHIHDIVILLHIMWSKVKL